MGTLALRAILYAQHQICCMKTHELAYMSKLQIVQKITYDKNNYLNCQTFSRGGSRQNNTVPPCM